MGHIDWHCDSLTVYEKDNGDLYENDMSLDIKRLIKAGSLAQFFAIWLPELGKETIYTDEQYYRMIYDNFKSCMSQHSEEVTHVKSYKQYIENKAQGRLSAFLTIEDGRILEGSIERLLKLKADGVSLITLTWNYKNCFGSPNSFDNNIMAEGLTDFGKKAVECMQELGMIVDVSHLSDGGFWDVAEICRKPFVASHSNVRALSPHPRNLTDEMIKVIGERGGIAGLNFYPHFLNRDLNDENSTVEALCRHAGYLADKGGIECVAIGSDLDGIDGNIEIDSADKMEILFEGLKRAGFSENDIEKIKWKNAERVIKDTLY